jgi:hypothetical protein
MPDPKSGEATGKPTPTQDENDRARMGEHVLEKEDDGSGPDPNVPAPKGVTATRSMEPGRAGTYATRSSRPVSPTTKPE